MSFTSISLPWGADEAILRRNIVNISGEFDYLSFINVDLQQVPIEERKNIWAILNCDGSGGYELDAYLEPLKDQTQTTFTSADFVLQPEYANSTVLAELFQKNSLVTTTTTPVTRWIQRRGYYFEMTSGWYSIFLYIGYATRADAVAEDNPTSLRVAMYTYLSSQELYIDATKRFENLVREYQENIPYSFDSSTKGQTTDYSNNSSDGNNSSSTNTGLIVGIVCGVILAVAVVAGIGLFILKKRKKQHEEPIFGSSTAVETQEPPIFAIHPPPPPFPPSTAMPELPSKSPLLPSDLPPPSMISTKSTTASNNTVSMAKSPFMDSMLTSTNSQIKTDPILSWVVAKSDVTTTSSAAGGGRAISDRSGSSGPVDIRPWQLPFDDLSIIKVIGEGSFGRVYLAVWHETNVAVKVLLDSSITQSQAATLSLSSPILQKLEAEGSLLASLRHPNIVNFMGVCTFPPAIVTEYCPRGSLTDVLRMAKENAELAQYLTWPRRIAMLTDAAQGMLFLHKHRPPIIHRDLKSPNLLVTEHFKVQISDFNLSKIIQEATATSAVQQTSNSGANNPRWLAVECLSGNKATEASDVFSFGVIMWEMMTFSIPWTGQTNPWSIVRTICDGGRLEIPAQEDVPGGADTANYKGYDDYVVLMNTCWTQEPANRPDFAAVIAALKKLPS